MYQCGPLWEKNYKKFTAPLQIIIIVGIKDNVKKYFYFCSTREGIVQLLWSGTSRELHNAWLVQNVTLCPTLVSIDHYPGEQGWLSEGAQ